MHGWYVDVPTNTLVVTVTAGAKDARTLAIIKQVSSFGSSARIEYVPAEQAPRPAEWIVGGHQYLTPPRYLLLGRVQHS